MRIYVRSCFPERYRRHAGRRRVFFVGKTADGLATAVPEGRLRGLSLGIPGGCAVERLRHLGLGCAVRHSPGDRKVGAEAAFDSTSSHTLCYSPQRVPMPGLRAAFGMRRQQGGILFRIDVRLPEMAATSPGSSPVRDSAVGWSLGVARTSSHGGAAAIQSRTRGGEPISANSSLTADGRITVPNSVGKMLMCSMSKR